MTGYVTIRVTVSQAEALENAADLVAGDLRADGNRRDAGRYDRACNAVTTALRANARKKAVR